MDINKNQINKYILEDNIDFYKELMLSLNNENENNENTVTNLCLITMEPLIDKYIELTCGHKFNYLPLFKEVYSYKKREYGDKLKNNEILCTYCRKKISYY